MLPFIESDITIINDLVDSLGEMGSLIIGWKFGLGGKKRKTRKDIAHLYDVPEHVILKKEDEVKDTLLDMLGKSKIFNISVKKLLRIHFKKTVEEKQRIISELEKELEKIVAEKRREISEAYKDLGRADWQRRWRKSLLENFNPDIGLDPIRELSIDELFLSIRGTRCLKGSGITTIGDLLKKTRKELRRIHGFGLGTANGIVVDLEEYGLLLAEE